MAFWLWYQGQSQVEAKPRMSRWPGLEFRQTKAKFNSNSMPKAMAQAAG
jgi:hypothetical protein